MKTSTLSVSILSLIMTLSSHDLAGTTAVSLFQTFRQRHPAPAPAATANDGSPIRYVDISDSIVKGTNDSITRRSGDHYAHFAVGYGCDDSYYLVNNFGCSGTCYRGFTAQSILLGQAGSGNPKPTGSMYTSNDCSGSISKVGIASGQTTECTPISGSGVWQSAYLYFNC